MAEFQVQRDALTQTRIVAERVTPDAPLAEGEVLVKVDLFAFTSNNMTYGQVGDQLAYWQFFPVAQSGWGVLPVWGFADVVATNAQGVEVGERLYGYFPPAQYLTLQPGRSGAGYLIDATPHRRKLPVGYNTYTRVLAEPHYDPANDAMRALLFPLFITSFCLWDALREAQWHGAQRIIMLSASSKTAIGLAYALAADDSAPEVVAVTSPRNVQMVQGLGVYSSVMTYDALAEVDADIPTVVVDMAGNGAVLGALHQRLGAQMLHCIQVGITHRAEVRDDGIDVGRSGFFFAPSHIERRMADWGTAGFAQRTNDFMRDATARCATWLKIREVAGVEGLSAVYADVASGTLPADEGIVVRM
ncbi:Protein of unknown function [Monaibacterium marinum]|uniref:DUF2855 domain-containing protein n=1 Tax=Pontivivens marinum TaxID=1690039 RepID=A0A2C9CVI7_9RHOB|nr:DUF2855 family protein [Monaibacterium marinum]SOH95282.1 Protein of unknown function [Monaibacterium marinum]